MRTAHRPIYITCRTHSARTKFNGYPHDPGVARLGAYVRYTQPARQAAGQPAAHFGLCGSEACPEDVLYAWEGRYICAWCMEDMFNALTTGEKAALLGACPIKAAALGPDKMRGDPNAQPDD